jgi:hypothetical protein
MRIILLHIAVLSVLSCLGQKASVLLHVDQKDVKPGEILTVTVKANVQGEIDIELPPGFVHGYNIMNGMEQEMDYSTGKIETIYYMSQTGAMSKEGTYTFGPALIKKGGKIYKSNTVSVTVKKDVQQNTNTGEITSKQLRDPAFGVVECSRNSIYEGEPVLISAKIYSHFNPTHLENYQSYSMDGVIEKHALGNNQRILVEETKIKGMRLYSFTHDKNILFPTSNGKLNVEPFKMILRRGFEGIPITSSGATIEVKPLPKAPAEFSGGVGEFTITRSLSGSTFKQGEVLKMTLVINGKGNLHNLTEPNLQLPKGFIVYGDPIVKENFQFTSRGAEGSVSYEYNIQITRYGDLTLPATRLAYFDPQKEKYIYIQTNGDEIKVEKDLNFKPDMDTDAGQTVMVDPPKVGPMRSTSSTSILSDPFGKTEFFIGLGTPVALAFVFGLYFRRRKNRTDAYRTKASMETSRKKAHDLFDEALHAYKQDQNENASLLLERCVTLYLNSILGTIEHPLSGSALLNACKEIDPSTAEQAENIIDSCQLARYSMGQADISSDLLEKARKLINTAR